MKLADVPGLPADGLELAELIDHLGAHFVQMGGKITDVGYEPPRRIAELVIESPDGTRIELTARIIEVRGGI